MSPSPPSGTVRDAGAMFLGYHLASLGPGEESLVPPNMLADIAKSARTLTIRRRRDGWERGGDVG